MDGSNHFARIGTIIVSDGNSVQACIVWASVENAQSASAADSVDSDLIVLFNLHTVHKPLNLVGLSLPRSGQNETSSEAAINVGREWLKRWRRVTGSAGANRFNALVDLHLVAKLVGRVSAAGGVSAGVWKAGTAWSGTVLLQLGDSVHVSLDLVSGDAELSGSVTTAESGEVTSVAAGIAEPEVADLEAVTSGSLGQADSVGELAHSAVVLVPNGVSYASGIEYTALHSEGSIESDLASKRLHESWTLATSAASATSRDSRTRAHGVVGSSSSYVNVKSEGSNSFSVVVLGVDLVHTGIGELDVVHLESVLVALASHSESRAVLNC